jgi:hypothetical protein
MTSYAFWNNKGGVGKSFLCFVAATEYAHRHPEIDVYVIDLCPQANVSETLLGPYDIRGKVLESKLTKTPRATVAGYLEARLSSPFRMIDDISPYVTNPSETHPNVPKNLSLICGDNLLEVLSEAIRQTGQLSIPVDAWKQVSRWIDELAIALRKRSGRQSLSALQQSEPDIHNLAHVAETGIAAVRCLELLSEDALSGVIQVAGAGRHGKSWVGVERSRGAK